MNARQAAWRHFFRPGDVCLVAVATVWVGASFFFFWQDAAGERAIIRQEGRLFMETALAGHQEIRVPGPLGETLILVEDGRARVVADPGPRQYCVRQGWLERAGEIAICAPNRVSLAIAGKSAPYDTLNY